MISGRAAPAQIADVLEHRPAGAVHVIAHGRPGEVSFSSGALRAENLTEYSAHLGRIREALAGAPLLLWSCQTGEGERGAAFVEGLARMTGAAVAASTGLVGAAARGGAWELDAMSAGASIQAAEIPVPLHANGVAAFQGVMAVKISTIATDTGSKSNDFITSDTTLTVTGTATAANDSVTVTISGGTTNLSQTVTANSGSTWTTVDFSALPDGSYTITAKDNNDNSTKTQALTVDTTAPTTTITSFSPNSGSTSDNITNATKITLSGTSEPSSIVTVVEDGTTTFATVTADKTTGAWSVANFTVTEGSHSFVASATDVAGNVGKASSSFVIVDDQTKPGTPTISSVTDDVSPVTGTVASGGSTNDNTPTVRVS